MLKINAGADGLGKVGRLHHEQSVHSVKLEGTLDQHTVCELRELCDAIFEKEEFSEGDHFIIDLTEVSEIDHVGFATLVGIMVELSVKAGSFGLILPEEHPIRRALHVTGIEKVFEVHESHSEAHEMILALHH